jgi:hypothetical protein
MNMQLRRVCRALGACAVLLALCGSGWGADEEERGSALPKETSRYNRGNAPGRYRDAAGKLRLFELKGSEAELLDGGGRVMGTVNKPVMLNVGAAKEMEVKGRRQSYAWAWATPVGSGWIARGDLVDAPAPDVDAKRNPKPPGEAQHPLVIDAAGGRKKLDGLRHINSKGVIPASGNHGTDYAGRRPGAGDFVYLLFACPNVIRGGAARDSLIDGSRFVPGLDEAKRPIQEVVTMYADGDMKRPVPVTFLYGRGEGGTLYGWVARANVGER